MPEYIFRDGKVFVEEAKATSPLVHRKPQYNSNSVVLLLTATLNENDAETKEVCEHQENPQGEAQHPIGELG